MIKILFITLSSGTSPSTRVRINNIVPELERLNFLCTVVAFPSELLGQLKLLRQARNFDVVYLQKKTPTRLFVYLLRRAAKRLVYDFDDAIYYRQNELSDPTRAIDKRRRRRFQYIVKQCDHVIAGNRILSDEALKYTDHCSVVPSGVETEGVPHKDYSADPTVFSIGWVGTSVNLPYLAQLAPIFAALAKQHSIQVRIISSASVELPGVDTVFVPWAIDTQEAEITKFDVGVMPLSDNPHARGKCAYKLLQYMAAGIPSVASDVGINREVLERGDCGLIANDTAGFQHALATLITDPALCRTFGENALIDVHKHYSYAHIAQLLAPILEPIT